MNACFRSLRSTFDFLESCSGNIPIRHRKLSHLSVFQAHAHFVNTKCHRCALVPYSFYQRHLFGVASGRQAGFLPGAETLSGRSARRPAPFGRRASHVLLVSSPSFISGFVFKFEVRGEQRRREQVIDPFKIVCVCVCVCVRAYLGRFRIFTVHKKRNLIGMVPSYSIVCTRAVVEPGLDLSCVCRPVCACGFEAHCKIDWCFRWSYSTWPSVMKLRTNLKAICGFRCRLKTPWCDSMFCCARAKLFSAVST